MTRHELKEQLAHDHFTDAVSDIVGYTVSNRTLVVRGVTILVILLVIAGGLYWYYSARAAAEQRDLQAAFVVAETPVGAPNASGLNTFPTQDAKTAAELKAFSSVASKDAHTRAGWIAQYEVGTLRAQQGDSKGAEADLRAVVNSGSDVSPLARIALARLYAGENRIPEARVLLEGLVKNPSPLVSKDQADILLAQLEMKSNPAQAKQILQSLKTPDERAAIARAAQAVAAQQAR